MRAVFLVVILAAMVGALLMFAADDPGLVPTDAERLTGVTVANKVMVAAKRGGRLVALAVQEGDSVEQGAEIAVLDSAELNAERSAYAAKVALAEAKLAELKEQSLFEQERSAGWLARAHANLAVARSRVVQAQAELAQQRSDEIRARELKAKNLAATQEAERLATDVQVAVSRLKAEQDMTEVAEAELVLAQAVQRRSRIVEQQVAQAQAEVAMVRAQLAQMDARLAETSIRAPLSGVVSVRVAQQGEVIQNGDPIVTIVDLDDVWVRTEVEESRIRRIKLGEQLRVLLLDGSRHTGAVSLIAPEGSFATQRDVDRVTRDVRTFGFRVALDNSERRFHSGMTAYVLLPEPASANGDAL